MKKLSLLFVCCAAGLVGCGDESGSNSLNPGDGGCDVACLDDEVCENGSCVKVDHECKADEVWNGKEY